MIPFPHLITAHAKVNLLRVAFDDSFAAGKRPLQYHFVLDSPASHTLLAMGDGIVIRESELEFNLLLGVGHRLANILGRIVDLIRDEIKGRHGAGILLLLVHVGGFVPINVM